MTPCDASCREADLTCSFEDDSGDVPGARLDLDRLVWDPEYRDEVRELIRDGR